MVEVNETYTVSTWSVREGQQDAFVKAFRAYAAAATWGGGAHEGMILQDRSDPTRFVVVRRWDSPESVERWREEQDKALAQAVQATTTPDGDALVLTKLADLG